MTAPSGGGIQLHGLGALAGLECPGCGRATIHQFYPVDGNPLVWTATCPLCDRAVSLTLGASAQINWNGWQRIALRPALRAMRTRAEVFALVPLADVRPGRLTNRRIRRVVAQATMIQTWRIEDALVVELMVALPHLLGGSLVGHGVARCHPQDRAAWDVAVGLPIAAGRARADLARQLRALAQSAPLHRGYWSMPLRTGDAAARKTCLDWLKEDDDAQSD